MIKTNVYEDIKQAKRMIQDKNNGIYNNKYPFTNNSSVYRFSNEYIEKYKKYLYEKKKSLIITASSDAILSSILYGAKEIDSIDISRFPKYYYELKTAAIKTLSLKEYINFFIPEIIFKNDILKLNNNINGINGKIAITVFLNNLPKEIDKLDLLQLYYAINKNLDGDNKIFWDKLFKEFSPSMIFKSNLFKETNISSIYPIIIDNYYNTPYLQNEDCYNNLKSKINDCTINHYIGNIFDMVEQFQDKYDLVNLSNIIDYNDPKEYKQLLDKFNLAKDGIILTYLFAIDDDTYNIFKDDKYEITDFYDGSVMIYKG